MTYPSKDDFQVEEFATAATVRIRSSIDPISLQAKPIRKNTFKAALGRAVQEKTEWIFTHDVELTLIWFIEESRRYQTHLIADLDNVIKTMLDAVTGPKGVLIDDNQIQSIKASWMTPGASGIGFELTLQSLHPDEHVKKNGITFVEFSPTRCYLVHDALGDHRTAIVSLIREKVDAYEEFIHEGIAEDMARLALPAMRPFPRARLGRFAVLPESTFD